MRADDAGRRIHVWSGLIMLGIFLGGAATGAGVLSLARPAWSSPERREFRLGDLELSPDQEEKARAIVARHRGKVDALLQSTFPAIRAEHQEEMLELRAILTEAQAKRLAEFEAGGAIGIPGVPGAPGGVAPWPPDTRDGRPPPVPPRESPLVPYPGSAPDHR